MEKTALGLSLILTLLLSYTVLFVDLATANPAPLFPFPQDPVTTPPSIFVYSPVQNETYNSTQVTLNFIVIKPDSWFSNGNFFGDYVFGNITSVYYSVDGSECQNIPMHDVDSLINPNSPAQTLSFSTTLNLTAGMHSIKVGVEADSYYFAQTLNLGSVVVEGNSDPINFAVVLPQPVIVVPENINYNESSVPLQFTFDTSATSWIGYSLDGKGNVTIAGNTTLTGLTNGEHNITVYANDTFGNIYASQTMNFSVAVPTVMKSEPYPTVTVAAVSGASAVVVVGAGLFIYFKKRKR